MRAAITDVQYGNVVTPKVTINGVDVSASCIKIGEISYSKKADLTSSVASCSVELDSNSIPAIGVSASVEAIVNGDTVTFFTGVVSSTALDPTTKTLNVTFESTRAIDKPINANVRAVDYAFLKEDGPDLPLVFGSGVKYPIQEAWPRNKMTTQSLTGLNYTNIYISGGDGEVQGASIDIIIAGVVLTGQFTGNNFAVSQYNKAFYTNVTGVVQGTSTDPYVLLSSDKILVNQFVYDGATVNFCWKQTGRKCYFCLPPGNVGNNVTYTETSFLLRAAWGAEFDVTAAYAATKWMFPTGYQYLYEDWLIVNQGATAVRYDGVSYSGKYVINIMPNTEVVSLYAKVSENGITTLRELDKSLYTVSNEVIADVGNCTAITIWPPISVTSGGAISDELYVTTRSPVGRSADAVASWLCGYAGLTYTGSFGNWTVDCVIYGSRRVSDLLDTLAYETCTPIHLQGNVLRTVASPSTVTGNDSTIISKLDTKPQDFEQLSSIKSIWTPDYYNVPSVIIRRTGSGTLNKLEHQYIFINSREQVIASTNYWLARRSADNTVKSYTITHVGFNIDIFDLYNSYMVESITYDLLGCTVSLEAYTYVATPTVAVPADPAVANANTVYWVAAEGNQGAATGPSVSDATQGWVWDGNTLLVSSSTIFGCRNYLGSNIANENPTALPPVGSSEGVGAWASNINGICRVKTGVDQLGRILFVYAYSPSIPYWLITNQTVQLGQPITASGGKKIYPIIWGA